MFHDWVTATGFVMMVRCVGLPTFMRGAAGNDFLPPWEGYHRALSDAQATRGQFLRKGFRAATKSLRDRICRQARKWHVRLCPLCC
jgi:hypothetical protein